MRQKRRNFTNSIKTNVVLDALKEHKTIQQLKVKYGVHTNQITTCKKRSLKKKDGFSMMEYSVYVRHCASKESMEVHVRRVQKIVPSKGHLTIMTITDKQFGNIINIWGKKSVPTQSAPAQIELV